MPRDKKQKTPPAALAPPRNNPFQAQKAQLQKLVKQSQPEVRQKALRLAPKAPAPRVLSDEEMFLQEMSGVARLAPPRSPRRPVEPEVQRAPIRPSEEAEVVAQLADLIDGSGAFDIGDSDEYIEGAAPGLDVSLLKRLRKGDFAVQGHLDLHGFTSEGARGEVERFVQESRLQRRRCVLIIHGRGLNSKDQIPVLKERLRVWLCRGRIARAVLCFCTALPTDGGTGAVYVLLRR